MKTSSHHFGRIGLTPIYLLVSSFLIILFLASYATIQYNYTRQKVTSYITETDKASLSQLSERLNSEIQAVSQYMDTLLKSGEIQKLLKQTQNASLSDFERTRFLQEINIYLSRMSLSFADIAYIDLVTENQVFQSSSIAAQNNSEYYKNLDIPLISNTLKESDTSISFFPTGSLDEKGTRFIGKLPVSEKASMYVVFHMRWQWLDNLLYTDKATSFLYSRNGFRYPEVEDSLVLTAAGGIERESGSFFDEVGKERYSFSYLTLEAADFILVSAQNTTRLFTPLAKMQFYTVIAILISVAFSVTFCLFFIKRKVGDLQKLKQSARDYIINGSGNLLSIKYKTRSLNEDTTVSLFLVVLLPLIIFQSIFFAFSTYILKNASLDLAIFSLNRKVESFEALTVRNSRISSNIMFDRIVQDTINLENKGKEWSKSDLDKAIAANIQEPSAHSLDLYNSQGKLFYSTRLDFGASEREVKDDVKNSYGEVVFLEGTRNSGRLKFTRKIKSVYSTESVPMQTLGYIVCTYADNSLSAILGDYSKESSSFYIFGGDETFFYSYLSPDAESLRLAKENLNISSPTKVIGKDSTEYQAITRSFTDSDWRAITLIPTSLLKSDSAFLLSFNVNLLFVFCILLLLLSRFLSNYIVRPIRELTEHIIGADSPKESLHIGKYYPNEFNELTYAFNKMTEQVQRVYYLEAERNRAELNALQAQINPHFMYNTFESIRWMNKIGDGQSVDKMIGYLSDLFRLGISADKSWISLREEVMYADAYLNIQKMRYEDQLHYSWEIEKQTEDILLPKLILQPLLENSIYHGIRELDNNTGLIVIKSRLYLDKLVIDVIDNGPGFTEEARLFQENLFWLIVK